MTRSACVALGFAAVMFLQPRGVSTQPAPAGSPLRIINFGAHPDDAELKTGGVTALWSARGHKVKLVAMTNGDIGHFSQAGGPLAQRRKAEAAECGRILGSESEVLDIHDGELMPSLENRRTVARLIREWQADLVMGHRPYDYHADHRYTGVLMDDAAVLVGAAFFTPDTPPTKGNPVFMYYSDGFKHPAPFEATMVVAIDEVADKKWQCIAAMPSQFGDADSWQGRTRPNVPKDEAERKKYLVDLVKQRSAEVANQYRDRLVALYGEERGRKVKYAEAFQLGQYGRQALDRGAQEAVSRLLIGLRATGERATGREYNGPHAWRRGSPPRPHQRSTIHVGSRGRPPRRGVLAQSLRVRARAPGLASQRIDLASPRRPSL